MANQTTIEWCDATFNPWIGCTRVSPGCDNCYAAAQDKFRSWTPEGWGGPRKRTSDANWKHPGAWNRTPFFACPDCGWRGEFRPAGKDSYFPCPACRKAELEPARRRVFCASLADVFDNQVPIEWRAELFSLIADTPNLDWLLLTKRIGNADAMVPWTGGEEPWDNVWLGATVVNQEEADRDIPKLLSTPARVRFLSVEPLLGPVTLDPAWLDRRAWSAALDRAADQLFITTAEAEEAKQHGLVDWVIVGGESGSGARPLQLQWVWDIVRQCQAAGAPVLVKQLGQHVLDHGMAGPGEHWPRGIVRKPGVLRLTEFDPGFMVHLKDRKGGDWSEWPEDLRVRQFPEVR